MDDVLADLYGTLVRTLRGRAEGDFARPTRTAAWTVRELLFHQLLDAQRALVALASRTDEDADVDAVTYWRPFRPGQDDGWAGEHARFVQVAASAYSSGDALLTHFETTAEAAVRACAGATGRVRTQGHVIAVADLVSTLVVEATVHLLDLTVDLPDAGGPGPDALAETRRVLEAVLGAALPGGWDDTEAVLKGTGRLELSPPDEAELGDRAREFPLLG